MAKLTNFVIDLENCLSYLNHGEITTAKVELEKVIKEIKTQKKNNTKRELARRRVSNGAKRLHNVDNKVRYARKNNDQEAIKRFLDEKEYIKRNIFD